QKHIIILFLSICFSCSSVKKINENVISGEFDKAINRTIEELKKTKNKKKKGQYELILKDVFSRSVIKSQNKISSLKKDKNPEFYYEIFLEYQKLIDRQNKLMNISSSTLNFNFKNYDNDHIEFRYKTSNYYLKLSKSLISKNDRLDYRNAYDYLIIIESINPNYLETRSLINLCLSEGKDHILLNVLNESNSVIYEELQKDILNINGYDLNSKWKSFHTAKDNYLGKADFYIDLAFKAFIISPERILEKENTKEKNIKDGYTYQLDDNGNVMRDSLGNDIKIDKIVKILAKTKEFSQSKSAKAIAEVRYYDNKKNLIEKFPLESEFWFRNIFLEFTGDKRVLSKNDRRLLKERFLPFPPDDVLLFNNSENIKQKLKNIIYNSGF
ncbi:MAG: hypothetical protein L7S44_02055, partial [Flavobacteriaceae bacterium]|nr:hypothetical protein [Flavobacteriaceae bacterium]